MLNNNIAIFILVLVAVSNIYADDGSWNDSFSTVSVNGGSIYSETENTEIELTKEILIFNGEYTKAVFQFKNISDKPVTVSCGFPVRCSYNTLPEAIVLKEFNNGHVFILPEEVPEDLTFHIEQNGKPVEIEKVLLEYQGGTRITYHYKHELRFNPEEISTVIVEYSHDLYARYDGHSDIYEWNYVIGTGGTWNGPIKEFTLIVPAEWYKYLEGLNFLMEDRGIAVFQVADYEPARNATFFLEASTICDEEQYSYVFEEFPELKNMWINRSKMILQPKTGVQDFVTDISASSFLPDKISVFTNDGVVENANFAPAAAFDGLEETSWCENVNGDGLGEYLEITLTKRIWGLNITNGFRRMPVKDWLFWRNNDNFDNNIRDDLNGMKDYYTQNNRIKKLSITDSYGTILYTLNLDDKRDLQSFPGICLFPGRYRFVIEEIYRGTRWQDTCLGEVSFLDAEINPQIRRFTTDPFYMENLREVKFVRSFGY